MDIQNEIINILNNNQGNFVTGDFLASSIKCSKRTIVNSIKTMNAKEKIIISTNKGYKLLPTVSYLNDDNSIEREDYIIWCLVTEKDTSIFDIADYLFVSSSTVKKDVEILKKILHNKFNLNIIYNRDFISLEGDEKDIRKLFEWRVRKINLQQLILFKIPSLALM